MTCILTPVLVPDVVSGTIDNSCSSVNRAGKYAKFYVFEIPEYVAELPGGVVEVNINLDTVADGYMFLLNGGEMSSPVLEADDDGGAGTDSWIGRDLPFGLYTIECTTYYSSTTTAFTLSITGTIPDPPEPPPPEMLVADHDDMFQEERIKTGRLTNRMLARVQPKIEIKGYWPI